MAQRSEIMAVYGAGMLQGIALVAFPAASAVFTSPAQFGLSSTQYGGMFLPQAITAVISSLLAAGLRSRVGTRRIFLAGLGFNLLSMALLVASGMVMHWHSAAYGILLGATACMGIGFGFTVPAVNTFAAAFFPQKVDKAVLVLNALLGLGTALAPVFAAVFAGLGIWWGLPLLVGALLVGLLCLSARLPLAEGAASPAARSPNQKTGVPARFWIFAAFALLYGICETMNGNWAALYLTQHFGSSPTLAAVALSVFWGTVTAGRVLFAAIEPWVPEPVVCKILPFVVSAAFVASACAPKSKPWLGILTFALAGLGCSALLPLTLSFGQKQMPGIAASVAGGLIAFYQIGYGLAAFGTGPLQASAGLQLSTLYEGAAAVALVLAALAFSVSKKTPVGG